MTDHKCITMVDCFVGGVDSAVRGEVRGAELKWGEPKKKKVLVQGLCEASYS